MCRQPSEPSERETVRSHRKPIGGRAFEEKIAAAVVSCKSGVVSGKSTPSKGGMNNGGGRYSWNLRHKRSRIHVRRHEVAICCAEHRLCALDVQKRCIHFGAGAFVRTGHLRQGRGSAARSLTSLIVEVFDRIVLRRRFGAQLIRLEMIPLCLNVKVDLRHRIRCSAY